jgi:hypothetical protein
MLFSLLAFGFLQPSHCSSEDLFEEYSFLQVHLNRSRRVRSQQDAEAPFVAEGVVVSKRGLQPTRNSAVRQGVQHAIGTLVGPADAQRNAEDAVAQWMDFERREEAELAQLWGSSSSEMQWELPADDLPVSEDRGRDYKNPSLVSSLQGAIASLPGANRRAGGTATRAAPSRRLDGPTVTFLRIQKTGSTTLADDIMPRFCGASNHICYAKLHYDWNQARNADHIVTMLRDPVERTVSEFHFLHNNQWAFDQPQWDAFAHEDKAVSKKLWSAITNNDIITYLNTPQNPAVNRQTLYLAGFKPHNVLWNGHQRPEILLSDGRAAVVQDGIDWKRDGPEILDMAKNHLNSAKVTFGLTDSYECSMKLFSMALGWPMNGVLRVARNKHAYKQDKKKFVYLLGTPEQNEAVSPAHDKWSDGLSKKVKKQIEEANAFDMQLYEYARQLFQARTKGLC